MGINKIIIFCTLFLNTSLLASQTNNIEIIKARSINDAVYEDSICLEVDKTDTCIQINIFNNSVDTLFLFDSYINNYLFTSKYLHHFNKKTEHHIISFLPIFPFLGIKRPDVVILGEERLVKQSQVLYHFTQLPPKTYITIHMPYKILAPRKFVKRVDLHTIGRYDKLKYKTIKKTPANFKNCLEFAIYKDVDLLKDKTAFYLKEFEFNKQAKRYKILRTNVPL